MGASAVVGTDPPQGSSAALGQPRVRADDEDGAHPACLRGRGPVAEGVDPAADGHEPACTHAIGDRGWPQPEQQQLASSDEAVLELGERHDGLVDGR